MKNVGAIAPLALIAFGRRELCAAHNVNDAQQDVHTGRKKGLSATTFFSIVIVCKTHTARFTDCTGFLLMWHLLCY